MRLSILQHYPQTESATTRSAVSKQVRTWKPNATLRNNEGSIPLPAADGEPSVQTGINPTPAEGPGERNHQFSKHSPGHYLKPNATPLVEDGLYASDADASSPAMRTFRNFGGEPTNGERNHRRERQLSNKTLKPNATPCAVCTFVEVAFPYKADPVAETPNQYLSYPCCGERNHHGQSAVSRTQRRSRTRRPVSRQPYIRQTQTKGHRLLTPSPTGNTRYKGSTESATTN